MFFTLGHLWSSWTKGSRRARWLYIAFAAGFVAMAVVAGIKGDVLVAFLAALFALATAAIAVLVPRLVPFFAPPPREETELDVITLDGTNS